MAKRILNSINVFLNNLLSKWLEDLFIFIGLGVIIGTTYTISILIANYVLGFIFVLFGLVIAKR